MKYELMRMSDHGCGCPVWTLHGMENKVFWCRNCREPFFGFDTDDEEKMSAFKELLRACPEVILVVLKASP